MKGIDYTSQTTLQQANTLKSGGYGFVCRYLVPETMAWKRLTKAEADIISAAGLQLVSIYEAGANNAGKGASQGVADGSAAFKETSIVGQPEGSTVYFAVDYDTSDYNSVEAYLKAAQDQIPGYNAGVYGSYGICEEMHRRGINYCWQTYAWSSGRLSGNANIYQYKNGASVYGIRCDLNESYGNEGMWNTNKIPVPVEVDQMGKLLDDLISKYSEDKVRNAIEILINQVTQEIPAWKADGVNYLMTNGYANSSHNANDFVDYGQMGTLLNNYAKTINAKPVSDWAKASVDKAARLGIIKGDGTGIHPAAQVTKEEAMVYFDRLNLLK